MRYFLSVAYYPLWIISYFLSISVIAAPCVVSPPGSVSSLVNCVNTLNSGTGGTIELGLGTYNFVTPSDIDVTLGNSALPAITTPITLQNGTFQPGTGASSFRYVAVTGGGALTLSNVIMLNGAGTLGGAIYVDAASQIASINDSTFSNNQSSNNGGVIYSLGAISTISNSTFNGNTSAANGGAIYLDTGAILSDIYNCTFNLNQSVDDGGALYLAAGSSITNFTNNTIDANFTTSTGSLGGGIYNCGTITNFISNIVAENYIPVSILNIFVPPVGSIPPNSEEEDVNNCSAGTAGTVTNASYNLIGSNQNNSFVNDENYNQVGVPGRTIWPDLGLLMDNGGLKRWLF
jgi:predicted outer membrane repeat protein